MDNTISSEEDIALWKVLQGYCAPPWDLISKQKISIMCGVCGLQYKTYVTSMALKKLSVGGKYCLQDTKFS